MECSIMSTIATVISTAPGDEHSGWVAQTLRRIQSEYQEMPGLCLTPAQAARLLGLQLHECAALLSGLVDVGFLRSTPQGYVRF
jgi:hypothetical protein